MKRFYRALPVLAIALGAAACDDGLTDVNENPNAPEVVPAANLLGGAIQNAAAGSGQYGAFGYWNQFYHSELWNQHVAQSQYNDEDHYIPRAGVNENIWTSMYDAQNDFKETKRLATLSGDDNLWAVAEIMSVYTWQTMTDLFGDIPYSEALRLDAAEGGIQNPKYDAQSAIYSDLLVRLKAAAGKITPGTNVLFDDGDLIYDGNMAGWLKFANTLRLRIAMRMADTDKAAEAKTAFAEAWAATKFASNADNADLEWQPSLPGVSPVNQLIVISQRPGDFRVSATLVDTMKSLSDPRLPVYANPAVSDGVIRGLPNGIEPAELELTVNDFSTIGDRFQEADATSDLMTYSEMLFLGAEAADRGWISGSAPALYREGITASLQQNGVSAANITAYLAGRAGTFSRRNIYLQKWIALYLAGPESWSEQRRTGVPELTPSVDAVEETIPVRILYPANEALYNPESFKPFENVELSTPLWWMK